MSGRQQQYRGRGLVYGIFFPSERSVYIGSTLTPDLRHDEHLERLRAGNHHCYELQQAWNRCGEEGAIFSTIATAIDVLPAELRHLEFGVMETYATKPGVTLLNGTYFKSRRLRA